VTLGTASFKGFKLGRSTRIICCISLNKYKKKLKNILKKKKKKGLIKKILKIKY